MLLKFGTKAETLRALCHEITTAQVKPLELIEYREWRRDPEAVLDRLQGRFGKQTLIIRSSAVGEDSEEASLAGAFLSVPFVDAMDQDSVEDAIERVFAAYALKDDRNQCLVQEQVLNISMCGVVTTVELGTLAPYYVINFDDESASHDAVTSGKGERLKTWVCFKESPYPPSSQRFERLIMAARELEGLFGNPCLDIEFAFDTEDHLFIFQVRPIVTGGRATIERARVGKLLSAIGDKYAQLSKAHYSLCGRKGVFSVMSDWNPAEMIGIKPRMLALSLYKELITDSIWAYQRDNYGYRNLRSFPLLISFMGYPYIDVRASFNSFVPATLDDRLAHKLVDYYIQMLDHSPADHDKVEFKIVFSCYYLSLPRKLKKLLNFGFSELELDRIKFALLNLTNGILSPTAGLYRGDLARIDELNRRFAKVVASDRTALEKVYWLIEDCKRYGTLPFAGLARAGFIAVQFLESFVELGIFSPEDRASFLAGLNTVARQMSDDSGRVSRGELSKADFLQRYGHLRPGTYDILSPRYDEAYDTYFGRGELVEKQAHEFVLSAAQTELIAQQLVENGIQISVDELMQFLRVAIEGREYAKFVFTRSLSEVLRLLGDVGSESGFSKDDLSFLNIQTVLSAYASLSVRDFSNELRYDIDRNREDYIATQSLKLPQLISSPEHVYQFFLSDVEPNFVTSRRVTEMVVQENLVMDQSISGKIVMIKSADPGYDWLFSRGIGGLVTMYGGANSHMSIRCAELGIPAVIGCGEENFKRWSRASMLDLDCANRKVRPVD